MGRRCYDFFLSMHTHVSALECWVTLRAVAGPPVAHVRHLTMQQRSSSSRGARERHISCN